jgi:hypothetical protein
MFRNSSDNLALKRREPSGGTMDVEQKNVSEEDIAAMLGFDSIDVFDDDDFEVYEDFESWQDVVTQRVYEQICKLDGRAVDAGAFSKLQRLWERTSKVKESLSFTSMTFPSGMKVGCVVDMLTRRESTHRGNLVLFLMQLV